MTDEIIRVEGSLTLTFEAGEAGLVWRSTGRGLALGPSPLPAVHVDGRVVTWNDVFRAHQRPAPDGTRILTLAGSDAEGRLHLTQTVEVYADRPFVRLSGQLTNVGADPYHVTGAQILNLVMSATDGPFHLFHVEQFSWRYRRDFFSQNATSLAPGVTPLEVRMGSFPSHYKGPTSCAWAALRNGQRDAPDEPREGDGLVIGLEFNGKSRLHAWNDGEQVHLTATVDDLNHRLAPGEVMEVPACFVGLFHGDWDEAGYATQRFCEAHVYPAMPDDRYPWAQYNSWGYGQDIHEAQQMEAIERCAAMGVEAAVMDLGWAVQIGEWRADPAKFPRGLAPLADHAHELGMKFGVHIPLAQANVNSPIARAHPEWLTVVADDYFGAAPLCLGHRPCREWLIGEITRFIGDYHLDYIVQDGEDMVKLCRRTDHTHAPGDSNYANAHEGLDAVIQAVREAHPRLIWENCEDGGCMLTYRMARLCHSTITVDNIATYATRQGVYGASYPFSPRYSVRYMQDAPTPYTLRSAIFGGPLILMQKVTEWDAAQMAATRKAIEEYKALRTLVRAAKIIHLLPPTNNLEGQGWGWDAIQAVSADRSRSVVMVYRARGGPDEQVIYPRGLLADATYRVSYADRPETRSLTGATLAASGVEMALPEFGSEIVRIE
jgi:alpha-galactosidase